MGKSPIAGIENSKPGGEVNDFLDFSRKISRWSVNPSFLGEKRGLSTDHAPCCELTLLVNLGSGSLLSITRLAEDSALSRQAITKHLRVLQQAGLVRGVRRGRENLFELEPDRLDEARRALDVISRQWDEALAMLKSFVEE